MEQIVMEVAAEYQVMRKARDKAGYIEELTPNSYAGDKLCHATNAYLEGKITFPQLSLSICAYKAFADCYAPPVSEEENMRMNLDSLTENDAKAVLCISRVNGWMQKHQDLLSAAGFLTETEHERTCRREIAQNSPDTSRQALTM